MTWIRFLLEPVSFVRWVKRRRLERRFAHVHLRVFGDVTVEKSNFGKHVFLGSGSVVTNSSIGDHSYTNSGCRLNNVVIEKFCSIGPGVKIGMGAHPVDFVSTHPAFYANNKGFVTFSDESRFEEYHRCEIGNDVWIGAEAIIMGNVKIGDGAIVAARAVVTKDVPPYAIVGGIPAKIIRYRFDDESIKRLLSIQWWNWDPELIRQKYREFLDPVSFINKYGGND